MDSNTIDKNPSHTKLEISHQIDKFIADLQSGIGNTDDFTTVMQLEEKMSLLHLNSTKTYRLDTRFKDENGSTWRESKFGLAFSSNKIYTRKSKNGKQCYQIEKRNISVI